MSEREVGAGKENSSFIQVEEEMVAVDSGRSPSSHKILDCHTRMRRATDQLRHRMNSELERKERIEAESIHFPLLMFVAARCQ